MAASDCGRPGILPLAVAAAEAAALATRLLDALTDGELDFALALATELDVGLTGLVDRVEGQP
jgi:hypothetical protein